MNIPFDIIMLETYQTQQKHIFCICKYQTIVTKNGTEKTPVPLIPNLKTNIQNFNCCTVRLSDTK